MVSTGLLDAVLQGLVTGSIIAAGALSLSLIYSIAEVPNFAHGDMITIGAYLALALNDPAEIPFLPVDGGGIALVFAGTLAIVLAGALGAAYEVAIFRRFRAKGADLITMVIVSLGLALVLQNVVLFLVGSKNIGYETASVRDTNVDLYLTGRGLTVQTTQRQAGDVVLLTEWGYTWLVLAAVVAASLGIGYGVYQYRQSESGFEEVHLVSPRILGVGSTLASLGLLGFLLRGDALGTAAVWSTRIGLSSKVLTILALVVLAMFLLNLVLKATKLGTAMRATADNLALAKVKGVNVDRVQLVVWIIGGALTALAGVLTGWYASNLNPNMGFILLLPIFAAVILGGISSPYGAVLGALVIGLSMDVGTYLLPSHFSTYRIAIAFAILILVLLVKPGGLWGDA